MRVISRMFPGQSEQSYSSPDKVNVHCLVPGQNKHFYTPSGPHKTACVGYGRTVTVTCDSTMLPGELLVKRGCYTIGPSILTGTSLADVLPDKQDDGSKNLRCDISSYAAGIGSWTPVVHYLRQVNMHCF